MFGLHVGVGTFSAEAGWVPANKTIAVAAFALSGNLVMAVAIASAQPDQLPERFKLALSRALELVQQMTMSLTLS